METVKVYQHEVVSRIKNYYGELLYSYDSGITIKDRLEKIGHRLWNAYVQNNPVVLNEINNYHPDFISKTWEEIRNSNFNKSDALWAVSAQYGYHSWDTVPKAEIDIIFESAVDSLLSGNLPKLKHILNTHPDLIMRKSRYGHEASLIHYVGSNGFELYRQVVPENLPILLNYLIRSGCDLNAKMKVYGGEFTMKELLNTSAHPRAAGLLEKLNEALSN